MVLLPTLAFASSSLKLVGPATVRPNEEFEVHARVDSDQALNAYRLTLSINPNEVDLVSVDNSHSLITVWQQLPLVSRGGAITFNGASIEPFLGTKGELLTLRLIPHANATSTVIRYIGTSAVYLSNGKGTKVVPGFTPLRVVFSASAPPVPRPPHTAPDFGPPTIKYAELAPDPINPRQKLLAFSVADIDSGIKLVEGRSRSWFSWSNWSLIRNPTAFSNDTWAVEMRVSDTAGNIVEATIYDQRALLTKSIWLGIAVVLILVIGFIIARRRKRAHRRGTM